MATADLFRPTEMLELPDELLLEIARRIRDVDTFTAFYSLSQRLYILREDPVTEEAKISAIHPLGLLSSRISVERHRENIVFGFIRLVLAHH